LRETKILQPKGFLRKKKSLAGKFKGMESSKRNQKSFFKKKKRRKERRKK